MQQRPSRQRLSSNEFYRASAQPARFPGTGFLNLKPRLPTPPPCDKCVPNPNGLLSEFCLAMAGQAGELPDRCQSECHLTVVAHFLHTGRRTIPQNPQSDGLGWLMPDQ
jgi:hypothetical protein